MQIVIFSCNWNSFKRHVTLITFLLDVEICVICNERNPLSLPLSLPFVRIKMDHKHISCLIGKCLLFSFPSNSYIFKKTIQTRVNANVFEHFLLPWAPSPGQDSRGIFSHSAYLKHSFVFSVAKHTLFFTACVSIVVPATWSNVVCGLIWSESLIAWGLHTRC